MYSPPTSPSESYAKAYRLNVLHASRVSKLVEVFVEDVLICEPCKLGFKEWIIVQSASVLRGSSSPEELANRLKVFLLGEPYIEEEFDEDLARRLPLRLCSDCRLSSAPIIEELIALLLNILNLPFEFTPWLTPHETETMGKPDYGRVGDKNVCTQACHRVFEGDEEEMDSDDDELFQDLLKFFETLMKLDFKRHDHINFTRLANCLSLLRQRKITPQECAILVEPIAPRRKEISTPLYNLMCRLYGPLLSEDEADEAELPPAFKHLDNAVEVYKTDNDEALSGLCEVRKARASMVSRIVEAIRESDSYDVTKGFRFSPSPFLLSTLDSVLGTELAVDAVARLLAAPSLYAPVVTEALQAYLHEIQPKLGDTVAADHYQSVIHRLTCTELTRHPEAGNKADRRAFVDAPFTRLREIAPGFATKDGSVPWAISTHLKVALYDAISIRAYSTWPPPEVDSETDEGTDPDHNTLSLFINGFLSIISDKVDSPLHITPTHLESFVKFFRCFYMLGLVGIELLDLNDEFYRSQCSSRGGTPDAQVEPGPSSTLKRVSTSSPLSSETSPQREGMIERLFSCKSPVVFPPYTEEIITGRMTARLAVWDDLAYQSVAHLKVLLLGREKPEKYHSLVIGKRAPNGVLLHHENNRIKFSYADKEE